MADYEEVAQRLNLGLAQLRSEVLPSECKQEDGVAISESVMAVDWYEELLAALPAAHEPPKLSAWPSDSEDEDQQSQAPVSGYWPDGDQRSQAPASGYWPDVEPSLSARAVLSGLVVAVAFSNDRPSTIGSAVRLSQT